MSRRGVRTPPVNESITVWAADPLVTEFARTAKGTIDVDLT